MIFEGWADVAGTHLDSRLAEMGFYLRTDVTTATDLHSLLAEMSFETGTDQPRAHLHVFNLGFGLAIMLYLVHSVLVN